jgi:hypothetical protein
VLAIGIVVDSPAAEACSTSAPPSTLPLCTTIQLPEVNDVPDATVSTVALCVLEVPVVVVDGEPTVNW